MRSRLYASYGDSNKKGGHAPGGSISSYTTFLYLDPFIIPLSLYQAKALEKEVVKIQDRALLDREDKML